MTMEHVASRPQTTETPPADGERLLYTVDEAARLLSVSRSYVYVLFRAGLLRPVKLGAATRVARAELMRFAAALAAGHPAEVPTANR